MTRVVRLEVAKLLAQNRVRLVLAVCLLAPFVFAVAAHGQQSLPKDTLFGRQLKESGFATPLVVLGFAGTWAFPLLTSLVAGDVFAGEDHHRTWSLLLGRASRGRLFAGKLLVSLLFAVLVVAALAGASVLAGVLVVGRQPLLGLDGTLLGAGRCAALAFAAWACALPPMLAFTGLAVLVSVLSRSVAAGIAVPPVVGFILLLLSFLSTPWWLHALLLTSDFDAWHGLLRGSAYLGPLAWSLAVSAGWLLVCVVAAWMSFRRREFSRA